MTSTNLDFQTPYFLYRNIRYILWALIGCHTGLEMEMNYATAKQSQVTHAIK